jgi:predicted transposase/invertase (TIGR01784 family)
MVKVINTSQPGNWLDTVWKRAIAKKPLAAIEFFLPATFALVNPSEKITFSLDAPVPLADSVTDKYMRKADVLLSIPTINNDRANLICFVEQQNYKDEEFSRRIYETFIRLRSRQSDCDTTCCVINTSFKSNIIANTFIESNETIKITFEFKIFHVHNCKIEELLSDNRLFSNILYIAILQFKSGGKPTLREKYAKEILKFIQGKNLSPEDQSYCLKFAFDIFRLYMDDISPSVREAYMLKFHSPEEADYQFGRVDGRAEGELKAKREFAKKMLSNDQPLPLIVEWSGLPEDEIRSLQDSAPPK